jgi:hypothetical protein
MEEKQPNIFRDAKPAPPPTEDYALDAVQIYFSAG